MIVDSHFNLQVSALEIVQESVLSDLENLDKEHTLLDSIPCKLTLISKLRSALQDIRNVANTESSTQPLATAESATEISKLLADIQVPELNFTTPQPQEVS